MQRSVVRMSGLALMGGALASAAVGQSLVRRFDGGMAAAGFGGAVAAAGDVDGDGVDDVAASLETSSGAVAVFSGRSGAVLWTVAPGGDVNDIDAGEDVDGDGVPDLLVGYGTAPRVRVLSGADGSVVHDLAPWCPLNELRFGHEVGFVGDVNADGFADLGVSALFIDGGFIDGGGGAGGACTSDHGEAYVYSGRDGALLHRLVEPVYRGTLGWSIGRAGDANGDGFDDFCVEALDQVRVVSGRDGVLLFSVARPGALHPGWWQMQVSAPAGDLDGDGLGDLFVQHSGTVLRHSGAGGSVIPWTAGDPLTGRGDLDDVGDVDGDGVIDFVVGSPFVDLGAGANSGGMSVFSGASGALLFAVAGSAAQQAFGFPARLAGDLDGDGRSEILVGAEGWNRPPDPSLLGVYAYTLDGRGDASSVRRFGAPCPGAGGELPRIRVDRRPFVGEAFEMLLRGGPAAAPAVLLVGSESPLALDGLGAPGCWSQMRQDAVVLLGATDALGMASSRSIAVPGAAEVTAQWAVLDVQANRLGIVTSDALRLRARRRLP